MASEYYLKNKEKIKRYNRNWKLNNSDKVKTYQKRYRIKHKENRKKYSRNYNNKIITPERYNEILNVQENKCAICGRSQHNLKRKLCVDHNHKSGSIRGLLCNRCNFMLGYAIDDVNILKNAIKYLLKFK